MHEPRRRFALGTRRPLHILEKATPLAGCNRSTEHPLSLLRPWTTLSLHARTDQELVQTVVSCPTPFRPPDPTGRSAPRFRLTTPTPSLLRLCIPAPKIKLVLVQAGCSDLGRFVQRAWSRIFLGTAVSVPAISPEITRCSFFLCLSNSLPSSSSRCPTSPTSSSDARHTRNPKVLTQPRRPNETPRPSPFRFPGSCLRVFAPSTSDRPRGPVDYCDLD